MLLGEPKELVLTYDRDAPADLLKGVFPVEGLWEPLSQVTLYDKGRAVFRGVVDEQNTRLGPEGLWTELVCRSMEAVLLDNEAYPRPIRDPSLPKICQRLLAPLGFERALGSQEPVRGELEVKKGTSCWAVLAGFCEEYLGTVPYVDGEGALHCEGAQAREERISQVLWAEVSRMPCKELSQVWQQSFRGGYDTVYRDPEAVSQRRRYCSSQSGKSPKRMIADARRESFSLTVACGEAVWPVRGKVFTVEAPRLGVMERRPARRAVYCQDGGGCQTRLVLEGGEGHVAG